MWSEYGVLGKTGKPPGSHISGNNDFPIRMRMYMI